MSYVTTIDGAPALASEESVTPVDIGRPYDLALMLSIRRDPLAFFSTLVRERGDLIRYHIAGRPVLIVSSPSLVRHVLNDNHVYYEKSPFTRMLRPLIGRGLLLAEGEEWKRQRQVAARAFQGHELKALCGKVDQIAQEMCQRWAARADPSQPLNLSQDMARLTLEIALKGFFDHRIEDRWRDIYVGLTDALRTVEKRVWSLLGPMAFLPTPRNLRFRRNIARLNRIMEEILAERLAGGARAQDLLEMLIAAYGPGAANEDGALLRHEALFYILAGNDTTANALNWTLLLLSQHPWVMEAVRDEIDRETSADGEISLETVGRLKMTRAAIEEAMRLYPPVWTFSRVAARDDQLGAVPVAKGQNIMICTYALHHHPKLWKNPEGYDPRRFLDPAGEEQRRYAYLPFGIGPRKCLGARFAILEGCIVLARILQRFELEQMPGRPIRPEPMITLRPDPDLLMFARARP